MREHPDLAADLSSLLAIHAISTRLLAGGDLEELLREILAASAQLTGTEKGSIQFVDPQTNALRIVVHQGLGEEFLRHFADEGCHATSIAALRNARRVFVEDLAGEPALRGTRDLDVYLAEEIRAVQSTPLLSRDGRALGVLNNHFSGSNRPTGFTQRFLDLLARMTADLIERSFAENALRDSERRFATLFERAAGGIAVADTTGRLTMVNDRYCEITGRSRGELLRLRMQEITHPEDLPANTEGLRRLVETGESFTIEKRYIRPDGRLVWARNQISSIADDAGAAVALLAHCEEITQAKRTEQLLAEQQALLALTASGRPLDDCLRALCDAVSRLAPKLRACVLLADPQRTTFVRAVASHLPESFARAMVGTPIDRFAHAPWVDAILGGRTVQCTGVARDGRWSARWRAHCLAHDVRASHSQPVLAVDGLPTACVVLALDEAREATEWEQRLSAFGAYVASIAIERDRAGRTLRESEERYRSLFESIEDGLCVIEVLPGNDGAPNDFRFLECNPAFVVQRNVARSADPPDPLHAPQLDSRWIAACRDVVREGRPVRFEHRAEAADAWFEINAFPFGKPENRNVAVLFRNVTERRAQEVRNRFLLALSEALRPLADPGRVRAEAARILGEHLTASRVLYAEISVDQSVATIEGGYTNGVAPVEGRHRTVDFGTSLLATLRAGDTYVNADFADDVGLSAAQKGAYARLGVRSAIIVPIVKGERLAGVLAVHDVRPRAWQSDEIALAEETAQKTWHAIERARAETALRESEAKFRELADNITQFAWIADPDGSVFWYNRRWIDYTGATLASTCGNGWQAYVHPDHLRRVLSRMKRVIGVHGLWEDSFPLRAGDGRYRWFLSRATPIRDAQGDVVRWFGTSTDIDDQRTAQEALREADRSKDEFLAILGHELRTPLAPIRNAVHVLRSSATTPAQASAARDMIDRQVRLLVRLIDDLLDISRIAVDKMRLHSEHVELAAVLEQAIESVQGDLDAAGHELVVRHADRSVPLHADAARLVQVFSNLLNNACKYSGRGGRIELTVDPTPDDSGRAGVSVRIRDDGIGMDPDFLPKLFTRFSQAQAAIERSHGGLGIGLALVRRLVEMHGGTITGRSDGQGLGSEFAVWLPVAENEAPNARRLPPEPETASAASNRRALVVDDNHDNAESLAMLLRLHGGEVEIANDGLEALAKAERFRPDVVLLDIGMPKLNGYDTCRVLRTQTWGRNMIVIAQTGWGQNEDRLRAQQAGFDGHLVKPIDYPALALLLASLESGRARQHRECET